MKLKKKKNWKETQKRRRPNLVDHLVLDDGAAIENFHGNTLTGLRVLRELHLSKCSFSYRPPYFILAYFPHHHFSQYKSCSNSPQHLFHTILNHNKINYSNSLQIFHMQTLESLNYNLEFRNIKRQKGKAS